MSAFKVEFTLKQHTPIIHFQSEQAGATLRATELKPKFDRFLKQYAFNNDFETYKSFLIGYDENKTQSKKDFDGKLVVVTFSFDPMPAKIKEIMEKNKVSFEVFQAPEALRDSGVLLPASFYVDENGNVKDAANGKHDYEEMKKFLEL